MKKIILSFLFLSIAVLVPFYAKAAFLQTGDNVKIEQSVKNAYLFGNKVELSTDATGDLVAAASEINIKNRVAESLFGAGATINIEGTIGKNVRTFSGDFFQKGEVGDDLIAFFGKGELGGSTINGDLILGGGEVKSNATVRGKTKIYSDSAVLSGEYDGDVEATSDNLTISEGTLIKGKLIHRGANEASIAESAKIEQGIAYTKTESAKKGFVKFVSVAGAVNVLQSLLSLIIVTLILTSFFKEYSTKILKHSDDNKAKAALYGILTIIVTPLVILITLISVIGSILGVIVGFAYILALILAYCFAAIYIGKIFMKLIGREEEKGLYLSCTAGSILAVLISMIPYVGPWVIFIFFLITTGSIAENLIVSIKKSLSNKND